MGKSAYADSVRAQKELGPEASEVERKQVDRHLAASEEELSGALTDVAPLLTGFKL